jgi:predicted RNase H-like HicB family nuclease
MAVKINAEYEDSSKKIHVRVSVIEFQEDEVYFVYSPTLDITGYGKTREEAANSYSETLEEFVRYTAVKGTVFEELKKLGWSVKNKKNIKAPTMADLVKTRDYLNEIFTDKQFSKRDEMLTIPA